MIINGSCHLDLRQLNTSKKKRMEEKVGKQGISGVDLLSALKNRLNVIVETKFTR